MTRTLRLIWILGVALFVLSQAATTNAPSATKNPPSATKSSNTTKKAAKKRTWIDFPYETCKHWDLKWTKHHNDKKNKTDKKHAKHANQTEKKDIELFGELELSHHVISLTFFPLLLIGTTIGALMHLIDLNIPPKIYRPPFTVLMGAIGGCIGIAWWFSRGWDSHYLNPYLHEIRMSICSWLQLPADGILFVLLPPLLFQSAFSIDWHTFGMVFPSSLLLAGPGVMICIGCTAVVVYFFNHIISAQLPGDIHAWGSGVDTVHQVETWTTEGWLYSCMLACILSATDPVAVVGVLHTLGAPAKLAVLIEGESLLNDGSAMVLFSLFKELIVIGREEGLTEADGYGWLVVRLIFLLIGGPLIGQALGIALITMLKRIEEPMLEVSLILISVFALFYVAEHILGTSGVLAEVFFGLHMARYKRDCLSEDALVMNNSVWSVLGFFANAVIFILSGLLVCHNLVNVWYNIEDADKLATTFALISGSLVGIYVALHIIRAGVVYAFWGCGMKHWGFSISWKEALVVSFSGLRGAVGLALVLIVREKKISQEAIDIMGLEVSGIVLFTLMINGGTVGLLYKALKIYPTSGFLDKLVDLSLARVQDKLDLSFDKFKKHWLFKFADFKSVHEMIPDLDRSLCHHGHLVFKGPLWEKEYLSSCDKLDCGALHGGHLHIVKGAMKRARRRLKARAAVQTLGHRMSRKSVRLLRTNSERANERRKSILTTQITPINELSEDDQSKSPTDAAKSSPKNTDSTTTTGSSSKSNSVESKVISPGGPNSRIEIPGEGEEIDLLSLKIPELDHLAQESLNESSKLRRTARLVGRGSAASTEELGPLPGEALFGRSHKDLRHAVMQASEMKKIKVQKDHLLHRIRLQETVRSCDKLKFDVEAQFYRMFMASLRRYFTRFHDKDCILTAANLRRLVRALDAATDELCAQELAQRLFVKLENRTSKKARDKVKEANKELAKQPMMYFWDRIATNLDIETKTVKRRRYCRKQSETHIAVKLECMHAIIDAVSRISKFLAQTLMPMVTTDEETPKDTLEKTYTKDILERVNDQMRYVIQEARFCTSQMMIEHTQKCCLAVSTLVARQMLSKMLAEFKLLKTHGLLDDHVFDDVELFIKKRDAALVNLQMVPTLLC